MKKSQLLIAGLAVVAVAIVAIVASGGGGSKSNGGNGQAPKAAPAGSTVVSFAYSPEKEKLLRPLIDDFNAQGVKAHGNRVFVRGEVVASGDAEAKIARGTLRPVAWSPASSLWGRLLNFEADRPYAPADNPSIVRTPLVIAMWEPMARALGWPRKSIGFAQLLKLARSNQGWAAYGHREFGAFKLVHTNPDFSTAGLSAVVAEYYAATGKKEGLTEAEVARGAARTAVRDLEGSIVHYGDTTLFIADQMRREGPGYASAAIMEEATLVDFNRNRRGQPRLVALYPAEGTFYSDNPFIVLDAPWVTSDRRAGAQAFQRFLAQHIDAPRAAQGGFRPPDLKTKPAAPITAGYGTDPAQPTRVLGLPEPRVLAQIKKTWRDDRKPANVLLVLDTSGSMADEQRLVRAKQGLNAFYSQVAPQDRVGLTIFSDRIEPLIPIAPFRTNQAELRTTTRNLIADGGTAIYDATTEAVHTVSKLSDRSRINAVVVLTDGEDTDSARTAKDVVAALRAQGDSPRRVRVFTIAYSAGAAGATQNLEEISTASGGKAYTGDTDDIESVYRSISSFF